MGSFLCDEFSSHFMLFFFLGVRSSNVALAPVPKDKIETSISILVFVFISFVSGGSG